MSVLKIPIWKRAPFLLVLIPLILGIIVEWHFAFSFGRSKLEGFLIYVVLTALIHLFFRLTGGAFNRFSGWEMSAVVFFLGIFLSGLSNIELRKDFIGNLQQNEDSFLRVKLEEPLSEKDKTWKSEAVILAVGDSVRIRKATGKTLIYFRKGKEKPDLSYGDILMIPDYLSRIKNSNNPGSFDYRRYNAIRNISFICFLKEKEYRILERNKGNPILAFFLNTQEACLNILKQYITRERELGVAGALLLGYRDDLDPELVQAFANVGVVHLIAISGLHVGLIYLILLWIFRLIPEKLKLLKGSLILVALWSFALLTGAHPSTLRAAVMFSFLVIGKFMLNRPNEPFNVLAASAFLLLCVNPFSIFDVGFQLSYLAVAGIMAFQRPIEELLWFKSRAGEYVWKMMSVSIAAQILTFPLALYYFHQFPLMFLFTNLILIPVSTLALYGEVALIFISFLQQIAIWTGFVVTEILRFINEMVLWTDQLSFVRWQYFDLTLVKLLLLYVILLLLSVWIFWKNRAAFLWSLGLTGIFLGLNLLTEWNNSQQRKAIVYQLSGHPALELVQGRNSTLYVEEEIYSDKNNQKYIFDPAGGVLGLKNRLTRSPDTAFISFLGKRFLLLNRDFRDYDTAFHLMVDIAILSKGNELEMDRVFHQFSPSFIVFDGSVSPLQLRKWKTECKQLNLHFHSVSEEGAWIQNLE